MEYRRFGDVYYVRIDRGEEVVASLLELAQKEEIALGSVSGLGAAGLVEAGVYIVKDQVYRSNLFEGEYEIVSLIGTITRKDGEPYLHLHIGIADEKGAAFGGHLNRAVISGTCELTVHVSEGSVGRKKDDATGLNVFDL